MCRPGEHTYYISIDDISAIVDSINTLQLLTGNSFEIYCHSYDSNLMLCT